MVKRVCELTVRDTELLVDVYRHRILTIGQIQQLHFPSLQTAYRRTRLLVTAGYLAVLRVPGVTEALYRLSPTGVRMTADILGVPYDQMDGLKATGRLKDFYFMHHFIGINDFRVTLKVACAESAVHLTGFIPDYYGEVTSKGNVQKYIKDVVAGVGSDREPISHTPDGVFALTRNGASALFFLEVDRGTEVIGNSAKGVLKSIRFYLQYLQDGSFKRYRQDFGNVEFRAFRALYVTTTDERVENIRHAVTSVDAPDKAKRLLWITTQSKVTTGTLFQPIWTSVDVNDTTTYQIVKES